MTPPKDQKTLRPALVAALGEAGAGAYEWFDQEVRNELDPQGRLGMLSSALTLVGLLGLFVATVTPIVIQGDILALVVVALLGMALLLRRWTWGVPGLTAITALAGLHTMDHWAQPLAVVALMVLAWALTRTTVRAVVMLAQTALTTWVSWLTSDWEYYSWAAIAVAALPLVVAAFIRGALHLPRMPVKTSKVTPADLHAHIPDPDPDIPWLVQWVKGNKEAAWALRRKKVGARAERTTGLYLACLNPQDGVRIVHDVDLPGADSANVDHVVVHPSGAYVIDTKRYGRTNDPGLVTFDTKTQRVVHATKEGSKSIEGSLRTAAWGALAVGKALGTGANTRAVVAVHNARVATGLVVRRGDGVLVEVIPASALVERINNGPKVLDDRAMVAARRALKTLTSSTTKGAPRLSTPVGMTDQAHRVLLDLTNSHAGPSAPKAKAKQPMRQDKPTTCPLPVQGQEVANPGQGAPPQAVPTPQQQRVEPAPQPVQAPAQTERGSWVSDGETGEGSTPAPQRGRRDDLTEHWFQMEVSPPAPLDEVPSDMRGIRRGARLTILDVSGDEFSTEDVVAMSGVCDSPLGHYVWYTTPLEYDLHSKTGLRTTVASVPISKIMVTPTGEGQ